MDWVSPENVIAVLTAVLGVVVTFAVLVIERRVPRRKRIGYRVQLDTPVGDRDDPRLGLFDEQPDMADATLVLLRIENDGGVSIGREDYNWETHGLTVSFDGRTVRAAAVTHAPFGTAALTRHGSEIRLPKAPLNRGQYFKLLTLLTGGPEGSPVTVTGEIRDGTIHVNHSATFDDKPALFSRAARRVTVALTACVVVLASIIVFRDDAPPPMGCARGTLTVTGSTAFEPVVRDLARQYEDACEGATVVVDARGSTAGIRALADAGKARPKGSPALVALSDGPKPAGYPQLRETMVAVSLFTLVLNDHVRLDDLTREEIRALYRGDITNWKTLGGPDLPVRLVSRDADSGTREVFQRRVLGRNEPANSSRNCASKDDPDARVIRCELDSTDQVLSTVAALPGAVGYTELRAGTGLKGLHRVAVDGRRPNVDEIGSSPYPYRETEYAYTWGQPPADSLTSSFLTFLRQGGGQSVIVTHGHLPCTTPKGLRVCGATPPLG
ncbi:substrate-binding domain-containing protein [Streptomyces sp. NPDC053493]|uniref:substrate-binding domain-containing protein n=1 Tax=Streptomyces sp. NPDC053493 TaxID=3365705 RepID=UPI0037D84A00